MKQFLRKWIKIIRSFLDRAEASLEDTPQQNSAGIPEQKTPQEETPCGEKADTSPDILMPFSKGNSSGVQSTYKDRKTMNALLDEWVSVSGMEEKQAKSMLRKHANVHRIDYMTIGQVDEACAWLREQIGKGK